MGKSLTSLGLNLPTCHDAFLTGLFADEIINVKWFVNQSTIQDVKQNCLQAWQIAAAPILSLKELKTPGRLNNEHPGRSGKELNTYPHVSRHPTQLAQTSSTLHPLKALPHHLNFLNTQVRGRATANERGKRIP